MIRFSSLSLQGIKPGTTGYFPGTASDITPGQNVKVIKAIEAPPVLLDPPNYNSQILASGDTDITQYLHGRKGIYLSMSSSTEQKVVVDEYTIQPDGSAKLTAENQPDTIGFSPFTGTNEHMTALALSGNHLTVQDPSKIPAEQKTILIA